MLTVDRPHEQEIAGIDGCHLPDVEPLRDGHETDIDKVEAGVGIALDEFLHAADVLPRQRFGLETTVCEVSQEAGDCWNPTRTARQIGNLDEDDIRDNCHGSLSLDHSGHRLVVAVVLVEQRV